MTSQYCVKPQEVEIFNAFGKYDVIMRKNIHQETIQRDDDNEDVVWLCDEIQCRIDEMVTVGQVVKNFDEWWKKLDRINNPATDPTQEDRIAGCEAAIMEILMRGNM